MSILQKKNDINKSELITIGIPIYNMEKTIVNAIKSCLNQTYKNIEILIVNDGSTDNSTSIISENISDSRIRIYNRKKMKVSLLLCTI